MKIQMKNVAAGPDGIYTPGRIYSAPRRIPLETARAFIASGAAIECPEEHIAHEVAAADVPEVPELPSIEERASGPTISYKRGWYTVDGEPMRHKELSDEWLGAAEKAKADPGVEYVVEYY